MKTSSLLILVLLLCTSTALAKAERNKLAEAAPRQPDCVSAHIRDIQLPSTTAVDQIVVWLAKESPKNVALAVWLESADSDRLLRVGEQNRSIVFWPALDSAHYRLTVLPDFRSKDTACLDSIDLRSEGRTITTIRP